VYCKKHALNYSYLSLNSSSIKENMWRHASFLLFTAVAPGGNILVTTKHIALFVKRESFWEADSSSSSSGIPRILLNPNFHCRVHDTHPHLNTGQSSRKSNTTYKYPGTERSALSVPQPSIWTGQPTTRMENMFYYCIYKEGSFCSLKFLI
jgi:hypothetical protein